MRDPVKARIALASSAVEGVEDGRGHLFLSTSKLLRESDVLEGEGHIEGCGQARGVYFAATNGVAPAHTTTARKCDSYYFKYTNGTTTPLYLLQGMTASW